MAGVTGVGPATGARPEHSELVALMIRAAHTFGLTVVAEGVEEVEQVEWLKDQSCDQAQGYLLSRPCPRPTQRPRAGRPWAPSPPTAEPPDGTAGPRQQRGPGDSPGPRCRCLWARGELNPHVLSDTRT